MLARPLTLLGLLTLFALLAGGASALANPDFETGDLSGWTRYSTYPPTRVADSGSTGSMSWSRVVSPAYAHDGSYGLRLTCQEWGFFEDIGNKTVWYCDNGIQQIMPDVCAVSLWFKISGATWAYYAADLAITVRDANNGYLNYVYDNGPNWMYDGASGYRVQEFPGTDVWTHRTLDLPGDYLRHFGRPMVAPVTFTLQTYADQERSRVDLDTLKAVWCGGPLPLPPTWVTPLTPCGTTIQAAHGQQIRFDVSADSPGGAPVHITYSIPPGANYRYINDPADPATGEFTWTPTASQAGTWVAEFYATDSVGQSAPNCRVTIIVSDPMVWTKGCAEAAPLPRISGVVGQRVRHDVVVHAPGRIVTMTMVNLPTPNAAFWTTPSPPTFTGSFDWNTPVASHVGLHTLTVEARDDLGRVSRCSFEVDLTGPPEWRIPPTPCGQTIYASPGSLVAFDGVADSLDPARRTVWVDVVQMPPTGSFPQGSGLGTAASTFQWTPTAFDLGSHLVELEAYDDIAQRAPPCMVVIRVEALPTGLPHPYWDDSYPCGSVLGGTPGFTHYVGMRAKHDNPGILVNLTMAGAPAGASFPTNPPWGNPTSGMFTWTPSASQIGVHTVTFFARDTTGDMAPPCDIHFRIEPNNPPRFVAPTPCGQMLSARIGTPMSFDVEAHAGAGRQVSVSLHQPRPWGLTFTHTSPLWGPTATASVSWTPDPWQAGIHTLVLSALDSYGETTRCTVRVNVA